MAKNNSLTYYPPALYHSSRWIVVLRLLVFAVFLSYCNDISTAHTMRIPVGYYSFYLLCIILIGSGAAFAVHKHKDLKILYSSLPKNPWQSPPPPSLDGGIDDMLDMNYDMDAEPQDIFEDEEPDPRLSAISAVLSSFPLATVTNPIFSGNTVESLMITSSTPNYISTNYQKIVEKLKKDIAAKYSYQVEEYLGLKNNIISMKKLDDWFMKPEKFILSSPAGCVNYRSLLGRTETGDRVYIPWADNNAMLIAGDSGSGKTASILPVFAGFAGVNEICIADGKASGDWSAFRQLTVGYKEGEKENFGYVMDLSADSIIPILERATRIRAYRAALTEAMPNLPRSVWHHKPGVPIQPGYPLFRPLFIVIDECDTWLSVEGATKEEKAQKLYIFKLMRQLAAKGRSAAVTQVLITQVPDAETMGKLRSLINMRLAFRLNTASTTKMIFKNISPGDPKPHELPERYPDGSKVYGRCVYNTEQSGFQEVQANFIPPENYPAILDGIGPVPDQLEAIKKLLIMNNIPIPSDSKCELRPDEE